MRFGALKLIDRNNIPKLHGSSTLCRVEHFVSKWQASVVLLLNRVPRLLFGVYGGLGVEQHVSTACDWHTTGG
jgi:hypothetical protein